MGRTVSLGRKISLWIPSVVWMGLIFFCSSFSTLPSPPGFNISDKIQHFGAYFILGIFVYCAVRGTAPNWNGKMISLVAVGIVAFYGMTDEFHQYFIPGRKCELGDWLADLAGGVAVVALVAIYNLLRRSREVGRR